MTNKKPIHASLSDAVNSKNDKPPYRVKGVVERSSVVSGSNYGGLCLTLIGDDYIVESNITGGLVSWVGLIQPGDDIFILVEPEAPAGGFLDFYPKYQHFNLLDLVNLTLESRFGTLYLSKMGNNCRDWTIE